MRKPEAEIEHNYGLFYALDMEISLIINAEEPGKEASLQYLEYRWHEISSTNPCRGNSFSRPPLQVCVPLHGVFSSSIEKSRHLAVARSILTIPRSVSEPHIFL